MTRFIRTHFILLLLTAACLALTYVCVLIHESRLGRTLSSVEKVQESGTLRLITAKAMNTYYLYKGKPAGFEYDLAREFAKFMNVELDVITPGWNNMFLCLDQGKGDVVAAGISITKRRLGQVAFSIPYMTVQQRIIHHRLILEPNDIEDLGFRAIHVRRGTSYHSRLEQVKIEGVPLTYILHDNTPTEELIAMVNQRKIKFTVADSNIALISQRYYPDIRIGIPIQEKESLAWAIRKDDPEMLKAVNRFFLYANETGILEAITEKYYHNINQVDVFDVKKFHKRIKSRLPQYKKLIQTECKKYGFDWRLITAVIYQESHFNEDAVSKTNVRGLMQVTHATAAELGIKNYKKPDQSIRAGIKYLHKMFLKFDHIDDEYQRMLFALASYNIGYGHVLDAIKLAHKRGLDPGVWRSLKQTLPLLARPAVAKNLKHGYARGGEPVHYIDRILTYYDILRQKEVSFK